VFKYIQLVGKCGKIKTHWREMQFLKFQADREVLSEAVAFAVRLLSPRPQLPQLSGVMLEADQNQVTLSVFDYEVAAKVVIAAAVDVPGSCLVQGRLLSEIVSKLPGSTVSMAIEENRVQVASGSSKFALSAMSTAEYPKLPDFPKPNGSISAQDFAHAVTQVVAAASREEVTPVLTAVMLRAEAKEITLVATDRFRVGVKNVAWSGSASENEALIPARVLGEISKTFAQEGTIEISLGASENDLVGFRSENKQVTTAVVKGKYPAVLSLFPETTTHSAVVNTADLMSATKRVALVVDREKPLRYKFESDSLRLESLGGDVADASEEVPCVLAGEPITVSLRPQFVADALSGIDADHVKISFTVNPNNPNKPGPVLFTAQSDKPTDFKYLLQPNLLVG
jgi:DNA polymerase III subunit beta